MADDDTVRAAAESLAALLSAIDRGEIEVRDEAERAHLSGARDALRAQLDEPVTDNMSHP